MKRYGLFIDNTWVPAADGAFFVSHGPADGEPIAEFAAAAASDVDAACRAARAAFADSWADTDPAERAELMLTAASILKRRVKEFAECEARDTGKPVSESLGFDIPFSILAFEYFANIAREVQGHVIPISRTGGREMFDFVTYEPYGVVAVISPYNFPLHLLTRSLCPALAAGNTVVCKASSLTPFTTSLLGEVILEAGFPPGVVNIISGSGTVAGEALAAHRDVDVIAFTGSEPVGRRLVEISARSPIMKKTVLELGGKGPFIVEPDCDVEGTLASTLLGLCYNQGEVCCAMTRLFLHEQIYDDFLGKLVSRMNALIMGDILDPMTQIGSLISAEHLEEVDRRVKEAVREGARVLCGGERYSVPPCDKGNWYRPTILENVREDSPCCREEVFGPVLVVRKYRDIRDAVRMSNDTDFGLGANVFTQDYQTAYWAARKLNAGTVWVNMPNGAQMSSPFGGNKNSGMGREYGVFGLHEYLRPKNNMWNMKRGFSYY